jgi:hypothetical protein
MSELEHLPSATKVSQLSQPPNRGSILKDRIVELRRVKAAELLPNPRNWREHPAGQRSALRGLLEEIGISDALIAYRSQRTDGALTLVDGHLRREEEPETLWPVLVLDLTDEEADKVLVTLDPLAAMATTNAKVLEELLLNLEAKRPELEDLLAQIAKNEGISPPDFEPAGLDDQSRLDEKAKIKCPECGHEFTR